MKKLLNVLLAAVLGVSVFSAASLTASAATLPKVTSVKAYNIDDDEINLKWKAVKGADGYQVKIYSKGKWKAVGLTKKTNFEVDDRKSATNYKFKVRAYFKGKAGKEFGDFSDVLSVKTKAASAKKTSSGSSSVTRSKAESVALSHAGLERSQVRDFECELDYERGVKVYEVSFENGRYDYEYIINAGTGKIVHWEKERD